VSDVRKPRCRSARGDHSRILGVDGSDAVKIAHLEYKLDYAVLGKLIFGDDKLREIEQKKLKEPSIELIVSDIKPDKEFIDRQKRLLEIEQKQKEGDKVASEILNNIQNAERMAQEYEIKIKGGIFDYEAPYEKIIEIYRNARKQFEEINWKEESAKLKNTINFYKEKSKENDGDPKVIELDGRPGVKEVSAELLEKLK